MKLFRLISTLFATAAIINAQVLVSTIATIQVTIQISQVVQGVFEPVCAYVLNAEVEISGVVEDDRVFFKTATIEAPVSSFVGEELVANFNAAWMGPILEDFDLGATGQISGTTEWLQTVPIPGRDVVLNFSCLFKGTVDVREDGEFKFHAGAFFLGVVRFLDEEALIGTMSASSITFQ